ncbi:MAG: YggS family pyridoxal phosphate-dependent enzyme [Pirellulaceae bacterium]|nr:YggS family pyridoxal phosphate-dependent enzyme [Pirellulaceae bacterium]
MTESDKRQRIAANWQQIQSEVDSAIAAHNRPKESVLIIGVTKYVDAEATAMLLDAGCRHLGENRPQVLWQKAESDAMKSRAVQWHMIGHVQRNKLRRLLKHQPLIHSVDSTRLLAAISKEAMSQQQTIRVLLEVNISGDDSKTGLTADAIGKLLADGTPPAIEITGLMAMAGWGTDTDAARRQFAQVRHLRDNLSQQFQLPLTELSMGMSGDFVEAIAEGATMVRIGSRLFEGVID